MWGTPVEELTDAECLSELAAMHMIRDGLSYTPDDFTHKRVDTSFVKDLNLSMTANNQFFERDRVGFLPKILDQLDIQRTTVKKNMLECDSEIELIKAALKNMGEEIDE